MGHFLATSFTIVLIISSAEAFSSVRYTPDQCISACMTAEQNRDDANICRSCAFYPPVSYQLCSFACDRTGSSDLSSICRKCVSRVAITDAMCIKSCGNIGLNDQYQQICYRCVKAPPITASMCIHACDNASFVWYANICQTCAFEPPLAFCKHACQNTGFTFYKQICEKTVCQP